MLYPVTVPDGDTVDNLTGFIDSSGTEVVPARYVEGGVLRLAGGGSWGFGA